MSTGEHPRDISAFRTVFQDTHADGQTCVRADIKLPTGRVERTLAAQMTIRGSVFSVSHLAHEAGGALHDKLSGCVSIVLDVAGDLEHHAQRHTHTQLLMQARSRRPYQSVHKVSSPDLLRGT